jgi:hypothetical protein
LSFLAGDLHPSKSPQTLSPSNGGGDPIFWYLLIPRGLGGLPWPCRGVGALPGASGSELAAVSAVDSQRAASQAAVEKRRQLGLLASIPGRSTQACHIGTVGLWAVGCAGCAWQAPTLVVFATKSAAASNWAGSLATAKRANRNGSLSQVGGKGYDKY